MKTALTDWDIGQTVCSQNDSRLGGGSLPAGLICMWGGLLANIPSGWVLCDGLNGTPDLRAKFIKGSAAGIEPGVTGGSVNHSHAFTGSSATTSAASAGTPAGTNSAPTFTGSALGTHAHELPFQIPTTTTTRQTATFGSGTSRAATAVSAAGTANTTSAAVALSQAVSAGTPAGTVSAPTFTGSALGTHSHTLTATGTVDTVSNEPVFYSLAYIQKT